MADSKFQKTKALAQQFKYDVSDCGTRVYSRLHPKQIPKSGDPINSTRYSIVYRSDSIMWHLKVLIDQRKQITEILEKKLGEYVNNPVELINFRKHQYYIFDDIIFNLLSMYDYIAAMIGYMFQKKYLKWNSLVNSSFDRNNEIGNSDFSEIIIEHHRSWVDKLMGFRSDLIHKQSFSGNLEVELIHKEINGVYRAIKIQAPEKIKRLFDLINSEKSNDNFDLINCSLEIAANAYICGSNLMNKIK